MPHLMAAAGLVVLFIQPVWCLCAVPADATSIALLLAYDGTDFSGERSAAVLILESTAHLEPLPWCWFRMPQAGQMLGLVRSPV